MVGVSVGVSGLDMGLGNLGDMGRDMDDVVSGGVQGICIELSFRHASSLCGCGCGWHRCE